MTTPQSLQIASPEDSLAGLGVVTNDILMVNSVFRVGIPNSRCLPVLIQSFTYLCFLHDHLSSWRIKCPAAGQRWHQVRCHKPKVSNNRSQISLMVGYAGTACQSLESGMPPTIAI